MTDTSVGAEGIEVGANFITIRGDSELGRFLNDALSQSLHKMRDGRFLSVANLQISLQQSETAPQASHHRSCSKINCATHPGSHATTDNATLTQTAVNDNGIIPTTCKNPIGPKWKSCMGGLNSFYAQTKLLGPSSPPPYVPYQANADSSQSTHAHSSTEEKLTSDNQNNDEANTALSQKSQSQSEIKCQTNQNNSHSPQMPSHSVMSASCMNMSELQRCVDLEKSNGASSKTAMCNSFSGLSEEKSNKNVHWRRTSVSKWIEAWEKFNIDVETNSAEKVALAAAPTVGLNSSESSQGADDRRELSAVQTESSSIPTILSATNSRSTSCLVEALPRNPIVDNINSEFVEKLQAAVDSLLSDSDCESDTVRRQVLLAVKRSVDDEAFSAPLLCFVTH